MPDILRQKTKTILLLTFLVLALSGCARFNPAQGVSDAFETNVNHVYYSTHNGCTGIHPLFLIFSLQAYDAKRANETCKIVINVQDKGAVMTMYAQDKIYALDLTGKYERGEFRSDNIYIVVAIPFLGVTCLNYKISLCNLENGDVLLRIAQHEIINMVTGKSHDVVLVSDRGRAGMARENN
jgi:hypothetical protein